MLASFVRSLNRSIESLKLNTPCNFIKSNRKVCQCPVKAPYTAICSVTIKKTGKQVDLGLSIVISALCLPIYDWKFLDTFSGSVC